MASRNSRCCDKDFIRREPGRSADLPGSLYLFLNIRPGCCTHLPEVQLVLRAGAEDRAATGGTLRRKAGAGRLGALCPCTAGGIVAGTGVVQHQRAVVGVLYGAVSALLGGRVDALMQRIIEILVGIPSLIIVILFLMAFPAGVGTIIAALSITGWVNMARLVRAEILKLKNQEFVMASHVLGSNNFYIIMKDLIPNTVGIIVIQVMFTIPSAIFTEAFLSFIGIGLAEPQASLGVLINGGYQVLQNYPHVLICPAIVIVLIMVCFSILGDGLRDALDPQMRK